MTITSLPLIASIGAVCIVPVCCAIWIRRKCKELTTAVHNYRESNRSMIRQIEALEEGGHDAFVVEDSQHCEFSVMLAGFQIKTFSYDTSDPNDREYKRIHAEEVAEKLNEKP